MSATIQVRNSKATITDLVWSSSDKLLQAYLETTLPIGGYGGEIPNPDLAAAEHAAELLHGRVISSNESESEPGRIY